MIAEGPHGLTGTLVRGGKRQQSRAGFRLLILMVLLVAVGSIPGSVVARGPQRFAADLVQRGRYLALAGDCAGCHTRPGGKAFAGGYPVQSPMGPIYSSNITPSASTGIGGYTRADFAQALRKGIRRDGAHLYPAMPYTAYQGLSDADIGALFAFFMAGVEPVEAVNKPTRLPFPFSLRASMGGWNQLFLPDKRFAADLSRSPEWNRGAYLVGPLAHCSACHSPRAFLMNESANHAFAGGSLGTWYAPNITSDVNAGIGSWSRADLVRYLKAGANAHAQAGGGMAEAVANSLQHLTDADLNAMATYVLSIAPIADQNQRGDRAAQGHEADYEPSLRGAPVVYKAAVPATGAMLYSGNCASCHGASGSGSADGAFPSLYHNSATGAWRPDNLIAVILDGVQRDAAGRHAYMPGFGKASRLQPLNDAEIAVLSSYVLASLGDRSARVSAEDVAVRRAGGETAPLVTAARWGLPIASLILLALSVLFLVRRLRSQLV